MAERAPRRTARQDARQGRAEERPPLPDHEGPDHERRASDYRLFRLIPAAPAEDSRWDNAPFQGEVVVRAGSPAEARLLAAAAELDFPDLDAKPGDGVATGFASAFRDDKLYHVVEEHGGAFPQAGEPGIVAGTIRRDVIRADAPPTEPSLGQPSYLGERWSHDRNKRKA